MIELEEIKAKPNKFTWGKVINQRLWYRRIPFVTEVA